MGDQSVPQYNPSGFDTNPFARRVEKPWGYELHWVQKGMPYMGKVLHVNKGMRTSLQLHDAKQESWMIMRGRASVLWENGRGELVQTELKPGLGYTASIGQKHRLCGITDADIIEVSTQETGTTWRLEDDFERPHETPEQRKVERGEG